MADLRELAKAEVHVHLEGCFEPSDLVALALPGLEGCPLSETDRFDAQTALAVVSFQQQVFSDPSKWDGIIGPETWAQLDLSYIDRWSLWLDLKILARTLPAAIEGR